MSLTDYFKKCTQTNKTKTKRSEAGLPWWLSGKESTHQGRDMQVRFLAKEDPTVRGAAKLVSRNHWPVLEGPELKLPRPREWRPCPQLEKPATGGQPPLGAPREKPSQQQQPSTARINKYVLQMHLKAEIALKLLRATHEQV